MPHLLTVNFSKFLEEMSTRFDKDQDITSEDVFECFVHTLGKDANVLKEEDLKALVFNQFKAYGDFDKTMTQVAKNVSGIQQSTKKAIDAIDEDNVDALKGAYVQLQDHEKRILKLEEDVYTDEMTGIYNRKYLVNHELDEEERFKTNGNLMHIKIDNFLEINKKHGHEVGDTVLKFVSKMLQKRLKEFGVNLIRYMSVHFIALSEEKTMEEVKKIFEEAVELGHKKKFKTSKGEILHIELQFKHRSYSKNQSFEEVYESF